MTEYEWDLLRELNGEDRGLMWGAAMSEAIGALKGKGLVTGPPVYKLTAKGREALADRARLEGWP